jgi:hypothetical protein
MNSAKAFSVDFVWSILVPQELGNETVTTSRDPCGWKTYVWQGAAQCLEGIICNTAITSSLPCSLWHDAWHLGFSGPEYCLPPWDITPLHDEDTCCWVLERWINLRHHLSICLEWLRETMKKAARYFLEWLRKTMKTPATISGLGAEMWTRGRSADQSFGLRHALMAATFQWAMMWCQ